MACTVDQAPEDDERGDGGVDLPRDVDFDKEEAREKTQSPPQESLLRRALTLKLDEAGA